MFLLGYRSGLQGVVYLLTGQTEQAGFAAEIEGRTEPAVCCFLMQWGRPWSHGNGLSYWVEQTIVQGKEFYPPGCEYILTSESRLSVAFIADPAFMALRPN